MAKLGVRINLVNGGLTQVSGWDFNSVAELEDRLLAADTDGLSILGGNTDQDALITSYISTPTGNFGIPHIKRIRRGYLEYITEGVLLIKCIPDSGLGFTERLTESLPTSSQVAEKFPGNRKYRGVNWGFEITNPQGTYFAIDYFGVLFVPLTRSRGI